MQIKKKYLVISIVCLLVLCLLSYVKIGLDIKNVKLNDYKTNELIKVSNDGNLRKYYLDLKDESKFNIDLDIIDKWNLKIPKIDLEANIKSGTDVKTLDEYIGHFDETELLYGTIGLAAHNRGYPNNYFKDLHKLELKDKIIYNINNLKVTYKVDTIKIIDDTDWTYLKNSNGINYITLITCVKNNPEHRLCVQGIKEREEIINEEKSNDNRNNNGLIIKCDINRKC